MTFQEIHTKQTIVCHYDGIMRYNVFLSHVITRVYPSRQLARTLGIAHFGQKIKFLTKPAL